MRSLLFFTLVLGLITNGTKAQSVSGYPDFNKNYTDSELQKYKSRFTSTNDSLGLAYTYANLSKTQTGDYKTELENFKNLLKFMPVIERYSQKDYYQCMLLVIQFFYMNQDFYSIERAIDMCNKIISYSQRTENTNLQFGAYLFKTYFLATTTVNKSAIYGYFKRIEQLSSGSEVKKILFEDRPAEGNYIKARGRKLRVVGVLSREGESIIGDSHDNTLLVPVNFARKFMDIRSEQLHPLIMVKAKAGVSNQELIDELKGNMRAMRRLRPVEDDNFALNETKLLTTQITSLFNFISVIGGVIGGFSILVGGFGIANIMFVSVKERTGMIGIQKSLGAKRNFILLQFLTESVVLSILGGLCGIILVYLITLLAGNFGFNMPLTSENIFLGLGISFSIGIVSGFFPAYTASKLDPVEAIRSNG